MNLVNQKLSLHFKNGIQLSIKREDLLHPYISGNKYRKLKYNLEHFKNSDYDGLITFGGAFSNHIAATSFACKEQNINCIGIIRGEELWKETDLNPTLKFAQENGMKFEFVTRKQYSEKDLVIFKDYLKSKYGNCYILPEGGTNDLAIKGCEEIITDKDDDFDFICCPVGTGGTISGIINSTLPNQKVLGFPALKGNFLQDEIRRFAKKSNWDLITDYHFGGYGKVNEELINFINSFFQQTKIPLDPVYTSKMVYGVLDLIEKNYFPERAKILIIHTGGIQGVQGMNAFLEKKKMTKITFDD